ncbi:hypothetical protein AVEN_177951-1, partial [Araneus ventricosus]
TRDPPTSSPNPIRSTINITLKIEEALTIQHGKQANIKSEYLGKKETGWQSHPVCIHLEQKQIAIEKEEYNLDTEEDIKIYMDDPRKRMEWTQPTMSKGMTPG